MYELVVEVPVGAEGRQGQDGHGIVTDGLRDHPGIVPQVRRQQRALLRKSIGEDAQFRQEGQRLLQHPGADEGIGIAADRRRPVRLPGVAAHQKSLPNGKLIWIHQLIVIYHLFHIGVQRPGDAVHAVSRPHHIDFHIAPLKAAASLEIRKAAAVFAYGIYIHAAVYL